MKRRRALSTGAAALAVAVMSGLATAGAKPASDAGPDFDLLIRGGSIVDGTGRLPFVADLGVRHGKVVFIGNAGGRSARRVLEAHGLVVTPGFIDSHNHADEAIDKPANRLNENALVQGVTTVVGGPDGEYSPAQLRVLITAFRRNGIGTNYAFYLGHNGIRTEVMGPSQQRAPTSLELARMERLVRDGMEMGALGLSTGLMYEPGIFSTTDEVVALTREVAPYDGLYDTHTRDPGKNMVASEGEAIEIGRRAGVRVKLGHLKAVGLRNRGNIGEVIQMVQAARSAGREVVADQYPYDGAQTGFLNEVLIVPDDPRWKDGQVPLAAVKAALRDPDRRRLVRAASEQGVGGGFSWIKAVGYDGFRVVDSSSDRALEGQFIQLRAQADNLDPFDEITAMILASERPILITLGAVDEADVQELLRQPWVMICSDGGYAPPGGPFPGGHPRATGAFARILSHYVRDLSLMDLAEGVRRMTGLPAEFLRLRDRGRLAPGYAADIDVFDLAAVEAMSTWTNPGTYAVGMRYVIVNGKVAVEDGQVTGVAAGQVLKRTLSRPATP